MVYTMFLAHLLGDYLFQWEALARWKARSLRGVLAHGVIVALTTLACAVAVDPCWWAEALVIGLTHTTIDLVRARLLRAKSPVWELIWYLADQLAHVSVILAVTMRSGAPEAPAMDGLARTLADPRVLAYGIGYVFLLNPAWVLLRFTVRGLWGADAAPCLGVGEKHGPMMERVLIATCILAGQFYLVPLVLLPRRLVSIRVSVGEVGVLMRLTSHWAETALSVLVATATGVLLRLISAG
jgi:hypothetical protein